MASFQTRRGIQDAYIGDTDPRISTQDPPQSQSIQNLVAALAATMGAQAATGPAGGGATAGTTPAAPQKIKTELWDDQAPRPKMTAKDYLVQALIPLGAGLLGGIGGGNRGAMVGAKAGLDAVGKHVDDEDKRFDKLEDDKTRARSSVITAKILKDLGGADGGSRNKVRFMFDDYIDPETQKVYFRKVDRETGEGSFVDGMGNLVPYSSGLQDRLRKIGNTTVSEFPQPPQGAPAAPAAKTFTETDTGKKVPGTVGAATIKGGAQKGVTEGGQPTKLPAQVKAPGVETKAPPIADTKMMGQIPQGLSENEYDAILGEFRKGRDLQIKEIQSRIDANRKRRDQVGRADGEDNIEARKRVEQATTAVRLAEKELSDFMRESSEEVNKIKIKQAEAAAKITAAKTEKSDKPLTEGERNASNYYGMAANALKQMDEIEAKGYKPSLKTAAKDAFVPDAFRGFVSSADEQLYNQAADDFYTAKLRLESGASIPPHETRQQAKIYQIQPGDKPATIEQRRNSRKQALEGLKFKAGRGADQIKIQSDEKPAIPDVDTMTDDELEAQHKRLKEKGLIK